MTQAWSAPVDLDNCAAEPIQVPGAIQPHGVLLAVDEPGLQIAVASANLGEWFGVEADDAIGLGLADVLGSLNRDVIDSARRQDWVHRRDDVPLTGGSQALVATLHRSADLLVVEIETADDVDPQAGSLVREAAMALQRATSVLEVAADAARWIRSLTGFDRVMVYRFDEEWNGEVIAEEKRDDLNSFLGLHYPSTDIPAQARELYRRNWLRIIPDIAYVPVPLQPPAAFDAERPVDLSTSTLRSVSPIHVEYLSNMGVSASMSVSVVIAGELWGLIACHHYSGPHRPGVAARNSAEFLAQLISLRIAETEAADVRARTADLVAQADQVAVVLHAPGSTDVDAALAERVPQVLGATRSSGAVVVSAEGWTRLGDVPPDDLIQELLATWPAESRILRRDDIGHLGEPATASGVLGYPLTTDRREAVLWFRPELVRQVDWGGDPHNAKLAAEEGDGVRLSPRRSFELWREVVRGRCEPWHESDLRAATRFVRYLTAAFLRRDRHHADLAADLQRAMRPSRLPDVDGWTVDAHDRPAGTGQIGGDWFDVFEAGDGLLVAVVGDVAGHGLRAAAEMAQLRNSLRAYLIDDPRPSHALCRLDRMIASVLPGTLATAVCAVIDTADGSVLLSHAGHVPTLVADRQGATFVDAAEGDVLLGFGTFDRRDQRLTLQPGQALVMYSDGLVERRDRSLDAGLQLLRRTVPGVMTSPSPATAIAERLDDLQYVDDTSVLVVGRR